MEGTRFGEGGGGCLNSQSPVVSFPGNTSVSLATEKSSLQSSAGRPRLGLGCSQQLSTAKASPSCSPGAASWVGEVQKCRRCKNVGTRLSPPRARARSSSSLDRRFPGRYGGAGRSARNDLETSLSSRAPKDPEGAVKALGWAADGLARLSLGSSTLFGGGGWLPQGNRIGREQVQIAELIPLHLGSLLWFHTHFMDFRAHLPRRDSFSIWPGKMPSVRQAREGVGGRLEKGKEAEGGPAIA